MIKKYNACRCENKIAWGQFHDDFACNCNKLLLLSYRGQILNRFYEKEKVTPC
jgi:hypothetical protein